MFVRLSLTDSPCKSFCLLLRDHTKGVNSPSVAHDTFLVGRASCTHFRLSLKDRYFSRVHFLVEANAPYCRLTDLGSRNGTFVNGKRVSAVDLKSGDRIQAGKTVLQVKVEQLDDTGTAEMAEGSGAPGASSTVRVSTEPATQELRTLETAVYRAITKSQPAGKGSGRTEQPAGRACPVCKSLLKSEAVDSQALLCPSCTADSQKRKQRVPGYRIVRRLGKGELGTVYLAVREFDSSLAALKTIKPKARGRRRDIDRLLRDARLLRELSHPHIVGFREMGEAGGRIYFAMDYVAGANALQLLKDRAEPLPIAQAVRLVCQLLEALEYAHGRHCVHRDIKPSNLLLAGPDGRESVLLADFGLAHVYQGSRISGLTLTSASGAATTFMPPEQIIHYRQANPASDLYAAAATLYYLLTKQFVFDPSPRLETHLAMVLQEAPVPIRTRRPQIPRNLAEAIHCALAKDPAERYADASQMRTALLPFDE